MAAKLCVVPRNTSDTPRSRLLGAKIKHQRQARFDGSLRAFAAEIGVPSSTYSKIENGNILPDPKLVGVILGRLGVVGNERDDILRDAEEARNPDWIAAGVDRQVSALIEYERTATRMVSVAPLFPPGMLQTEDTAQAIVDDGTVAEGQIRAKVTARMGRKEALWRTKPLRFEAFLGMRTIERALGGAAVAIDQLKYTLKMAQLNNVTVRAVEETDEFNPADMGGFVLYEFPVGDPIVYFEHYRSSMFAPKRDVPDMVKAVERLEKIAMSPARTAGLIADVIKRMERRHHDGTPGA